MNRLGTALFAAVEAIVAVGVGLGIALVPLTLLWGLEYGLQVPWSVFWHASASVWLIGHGVDVSFLLNAATAKASGLTGATDPITVGLAALGFAIVTAWIGVRSGRRLAETEHRAVGLLTAVLVVAAAGAAIGIGAQSAASTPVMWQAVVFPALWFGVPLVVGAEVARRRRGAEPDPVTGAVVRAWETIPAVWRTVVATSMRAGAASVAVVLAVAAVLVGFLVLGSYAEVITLYERSHAGVVGGLAITVGELAYLPDAIGWAFSWLVGPGFSLGTGSTVSPIATTLGPIPGIPLFGALPTSGHSFGLVWVLVPVIAGFVGAALLRPRLVAALGHENAALPRAVAGLGAGVVAGVLAGFVAGVTSGSFGPGRLETVGPDALTVGLFAALEVGVPAAIALAIGSDLVRLPERQPAWTRDNWVHDDADEPVAQETETHDADGGFIGALDRAGAGRTTDVHRYVVEETHAPAPAPAPEPEPAPEPVAEDVDEHEAERALLARAATPDAEPEPTIAGREPVEGRVSRLSPPARPDRRWRVAPEPASWALAVLKRAAGGAIDRARDGVDRVRDGAEGLRARVDPVEDRPLAPHEAGVGVDEQPGFPWRTEEYVAGRDDETAEQPAPAAAPAPSKPQRPHVDGRTGWDVTDEIPEHELPWWRQPKGTSGDQ